MYGKCMFVGSLLMVLDCIPTLNVCVSSLVKL